VTEVSNAMPENDILFFVAEIAVAFAGLVTAISERSDQSEAQARLELGLLANVLGQSLICNHVRTHTGRARWHGC
jgi:hypothetical protein